MLKLQRIKIENYGNLQKVDLKDLRRLNILIGPNNSGKTHILKAIEELNNLAAAIKYEKNIYGSIHGVDREEKYLKREENRVKIEFHLIDSASNIYKLILKEKEDKILRLDRLEGDESKIQQELEKREPILYCPEERLQRYRERKIEEYITEKLENSAEHILAEFLNKIDPRLSNIVKIDEYKIERAYERKIGCKISEQGSGVRSIICLMADILSSPEKDIILIDEPELGLNPAARQSFLKWLLRKSKEKQIFIATHDPSFVNPLLLSKEDVSIYFFSAYKASKGENPFVRLDLSQIEEPNLFAGFMPHTTSLKDIHLYVEGGFDAYVFQGLLYSYLKSRVPSDWYKILNKVGIYHLHGDIWSHLLYTVVKEPYKAVVILDGDKKDDAEEKVKVLNEYGENKIFPKFEFCGSIDSLREELKKDSTCPVYCLEKNDLRDYFKEQSKDKIINAAWSGEVPDEFQKIFEIVLSKYLPSDEQKVEEIVFYDDFKEFKEWEQYGQGKIEPSSDVAYKGKHSLKKDKYSDPSGGYKKLPKVINRKEVECIIFSGWIYRPSEQVRTEGYADRLAIEDENFNGYGFFAGHNGELRIEKRTEGKDKKLEEVEWKPVEDEWYQFKLIIRKDKLDLYIYNKEGNEIGKIEGVVDDEYDLFDRVVVHGGYVYYVDCIEVKVVKSPLSQ